MKLRLGTGESLRTYYQAPVVAKLRKVPERQRHAVLRLVGSAVLTYLVVTGVHLAVLIAFGSFN